MSKIFSTALLVSCATAQLTTSAWIAGQAISGVSYVGSVINVDNDRTTLSISVDGLGDMTDAVEDVAQTITLGGNTYYGFNAGADDDGVTVSVYGQCTRENTDDNSATCTLSTKGLDAAVSSLCDLDADNELCSGGPLDTATTTTLPEGYFDMVPIVVTAGEDLLPSASAAATPSANSASATASTSSASTSAKPTTSGSQQATSSEASSTSQAAPESTNAAPLMTMVPALAGLGAAAAFFL